MNIDRGTNGRNARLRSLDTESHSDFVRGFRDWTFKDLDATARKRASALLADARLNDENPETLRQLFEPDPVIGTRLRCWITSQQLMWKGLVDHFEQHKDDYLAEFAKTDNIGPGTLELNPDLNPPDYTKHEIHIQPGGYTGNEFGGPIHHYGTDAFYRGQNDADEMHIGLAETLPIPKDGKVERIVDLGCAVGQLTVTLKEAFPQAEVWGFDVGGPLVRYAHHRAVKMGVDVHFAQRLAEDTKLPDNSVDVAVAYIVFHEVSPEGAKAICAEAMRILRPGGIFEVIDFPTGERRRRATDPYGKYFSWADHTYNTETWSRGFVEGDQLKTMAEAGFEVEMGPDKHWGINNYVGTKPMASN